MTPIMPPLAPANSHPVLFGVDQPGVVGQPDIAPLPGMIDDRGVVLTVWRPSDAERAHLSRGGDIYLWVWTGGHPLQPVDVETDLGLQTRAHTTVGSGLLHDAVTLLGNIGLDRR